VPLLENGEHTQRELSLVDVIDASPESLPDDVRSVQDKIAALIDGRSARQVMFSLKNTEPPAREYHPRKRWSESELSDMRRAEAETMVQSAVEAMDYLRQGTRLLEVSDDVFETMDGERLEFAKAMSQARQLREIKG
jgi:hypothetical protein